MLREQIKENRLKFAKGLQESHREKTVEKLENYNLPNQRCCLGHGCDIFNIKKRKENNSVYFGKGDNYAIAPLELVDLLGLTNSTGSGYMDSSLKNVELHNDIKSLTGLNDDTNITTHEIGKLMENWIEGGEGTPFKPLSDYPEN